jgi:LuxR family maltose regulon positive regulatory protein
MEQARQIALTRLGELCLTHLDMAFGNTDALPEWMRRIEAIQRTLYGVTQPHAVMLHCLMLLLEKRHAELYALTKSAMETAQAMHYALLQVYHRIFLTRAGLDAGRDREAVDHLRDALAVALPDRVYLPFAEHGDALLPLLERLRGDFDTGRMEECLALCRRWIVGVAVLRRLLPEKSSALTPRQRDIALLIRDGLSAKQIAAKLFLSENYVASVRKEIYRKLHIHSHMDLAKAKLRPPSR